MSLAKPVKCVLAIVYEFPEGNFDWELIPGLSHPDKFQSLPVHDSLTCIQVAIDVGPAFTQNIHDGSGSVLVHDIEAFLAPLKTGPKIGNAAANCSSWVS
jgi:hypothetical protein